VRSAQLQHTHVAEMQQMFGPQTSPASGNIFSPPSEKSVIQEFVTPTLNKFRRGKMKGES